MQESDKNILIDSSKVIESKKAFDVRIIRNGRVGLQIYLQSKLDWSMFRSKQNEQTKNIGKVPCYYPEKDHYPEIPGAFAGDGWEFEDYPNLWMLLARDLDKGVTFNFGLIPVSGEKLTVWVAKLKEQVKAMYLTFMKDVDTTVYFTTETVERSQED